MSPTQREYAQSQADGLDNIAPTPIQGERAWQYALTDNFLSPEERADVMRQQLEPYRTQLEASLAAVGWGPDNLAKHPSVQDALFSGQSTVPLGLSLTPETRLNGTLRIVLTEDGPDIRVTPVAPVLQIPQTIEGLQLSKQEQAQLAVEGSLARPVPMLENGEYLPTYIRLDRATNAIELWRVRSEEMPTKLLGIDLTKDQQLQLIHGRPVHLSGLLDKQGEPFEAVVSISASKQTLQFADLNRLNVQLKPTDEFRQQLAQNNDGAKTDLNKSRELAVGAPVVTNRQSEAIKEFLEKEPQEQTRKLRP